MEGVPRQISIINIKWSTYYHHFLMSTPLKMKEEEEHGKFRYFRTNRKKAVC